MENLGFYLLIEEKNNPLSQKQQEELLNIILEETFGQYEEMCLNKKSFDFSAFNEKAFLKSVLGKKKQEFQLRSGVTDTYFRGDLNINVIIDNGRNRIDLYINKKEALTSRVITNLEIFVQKIIPLFKNVGEGYCRVTGFDYEKFYKEHELSPLNSGFFNYLNWMHFIGKPYYEYFGYKKQDLLAAPAHKTLELENEAVFIQTSKSPPNWEDVDYLESIKNLNKYLVEKSSY